MAILPLTSNHIFALNSLVDYYTSKRKRLYVAFVDYRKAFDLVDRTSLWTKLIATGIDGKILRVIHHIYDNAKACVKSGNRLSEEFPSKVGVRQGDNLSPLLFSLYLNDFQDFLSNAYPGLNTIGSDIHNTLSNNDIELFLELYVLLYADDTLIMAESEEQLQAALNALEEYCTLWQLEVNLDKTKVIIFSRGKVRRHMPFSFAGQPVECVDEYIYLGITFTYNNSFTKVIDKQLTLARKAQF